MATHSSVLAWRIPGMAEPSGLCLVGCRLWGCTESDMTETTLQQQQQQPSELTGFLSSVSCSRKSAKEKKRGFAKEHAAADAAKSLQVSESGRPRATP